MGLCVYHGMNVFARGKRKKAATPDVFVFWDLSSNPGALRGLLAWRERLNPISKCCRSPWTCAKRRRPHTQRYGPTVNADLNLNLPETCLSCGYRWVYSSVVLFRRPGALFRGKTGTLSCTTKGMSLGNRALSHISFLSWWMIKASGMSGTTARRSKPRPWTGWQQRESNWRITTSNRSAARPGASSWREGRVHYRDRTICPGCSNHSSWSLEEKL